MSARCYAMALMAALTALGLVTPALGQSGDMQRSPSTVSAEARALERFHDGQRALEGDELLTAARHFREALSLDPTLLVARRGYARILIVTDRLDRAQAVLATGLERVPDDLATARMLARVAQQNDDPATAIRALKAIRPPADAPTTDIPANLAALYRQTGQYSEAAAVYADLRRVEPDNPTWVLGEAVCLDRLGRTQPARSAWGDLLEYPDVDQRILDYARNRHQALRDFALPYGD
ncbi:tetratricopeptide repeat protein [Spiribacter sp. SSL99]|uniref:tetratricopeptide repeat protein n=1 Tax=Spiribacter sp. SSL99 TaxID=1866884 RepID=UPI0013307ADE|nr:tetratricopeptide repeat protein [Spiribacter sp. SSL99]